MRRKTLHQGDDEQEFAIRTRLIRIKATFFHLEVSSLTQRASTPVDKIILVEPSGCSFGMDGMLLCICILPPQNWNLAFKLERVYHSVGTI